MELYGRVGSSTCVISSIARLVSSNKSPGLTRTERQLGASLRTIRHNLVMRQACSRWRKAVLR